MMAVPLDDTQAKRFCATKVSCSGFGKAVSIQSCLGNIGLKLNAGNYCKLESKLE